MTVNFRPSLAELAPLDAEVLRKQRTGTSATLPLTERRAGAQAREALNKRYIPEEARFQPKTNSYGLITNIIAL